MTKHSKYGFRQHKNNIEKNANGKSPPKTFGGMMVMAVMMPGMRMRVRSMIVIMLPGFGARWRIMLVYRGGLCFAQGTML
jgi:hypothetical protein